MRGVRSSNDGSSDLDLPRLARREHVVNALVQRDLPSSRRSIRSPLTTSALALLALIFSDSAKPAGVGSQMQVSSTVGSSRQCWVWRRPMSPGAPMTARGVGGILLQVGVWGRGRRAEEQRVEWGGSHLNHLPATKCSRLVELSLHDLQPINMKALPTCRCSLTSLTLLFAERLSPTKGFHSQQ